MTTPRRVYVHGRPRQSCRTIRVDSTAVNFLDFGITREDADALYERGYAAGQAFEADWDWADYVKQIRQDG